MRLIRFIALCIAAVFLLTGCFYTRVLEYMATAPYDTSFTGMEYTRPDLDALLAAAEAATSSAQQDAPFLSLAGKLIAFEDLCNDFVTNYHLSNIRYSSDLTDSYWEEEYNYCQERLPQLEQAQEQVYRAVARSVHREALETDEYYGADFFDAYDGELLYDDYFLSLSQQEAALEARYYELCDTADPMAADYYSTDAMEMAELYVELVSLRQEIAEYAGYPSFAHYTYDTYYGRDYTPEEAQRYLQSMGEALRPVFCDLCESGDFGFSYEYCTDSAAFLYVQNATDAMGGTVSEAFAHMEENALYDIRYSANKYGASFEVFLPSYAQPFIFVCPTLDSSDKLTFAHEFGHFSNDYACGGSYCGIDVAEVHSQGFEYLSLCYTKGARDLTNYKMVDSLFSYLQCAAHALFELQVYQLSPQELTVENILRIQSNIGAQFGFEWLEWNSLDFVQITHFYTSPMYMISYVVSNDLAMQIYQRELESPGQGLALYEEILYTNESRIVAFSQEYGLVSPFSPGRPGELAQFFREVFGTKLSGALSAA